MRLHLAVVLAVMLWSGVSSPVRAQSGVGGRSYDQAAPRPRTRGSYGPRMSFGEFGMRLNRGYAYGSPYGGLGSLNYGFGYGFGPGYPPGGSTIYSSAYNVPSPNPVNSGFYPPFAAYGAAYQNPAVFPSPGPNDGGFVRGYPRTR